MERVFIVDDSDDLRMMSLKNSLIIEGKRARSFCQHGDVLDKNSVYCFSPAKRWQEGDIEALGDNSTLAAGRLSYEQIRLLNEKNIRYINLLSDEEFAVKNSLLTAEATLAIVISKTDKSLSQLSILITGYGRLAQAICKVFSCLAVDITVAADNKQERAHAKLYCQKTLDMHQNLSTFDVILNTIPAQLFTDDDLKSISADTLYLELASVPSASAEFLTKHKVRYEQAHGLPAKFSCESSAQLLKETLFRLL